MTDPLLETMEAWRANAPRYVEASGDPDLAPKAPNQTWASYGRSIWERESVRNAGPTTTRGLISLVERQETYRTTGGNYSSALKTLDTEAWQEYNESLTESPVQSPETVKLEVIFIEQRVSDAIVDESYSAFIPQS